MKFNWKRMFFALPFLWVMNLVLEYGIEIHASTIAWWVIMIGCSFCAYWVYDNLIDVNKI